MSDKTMAELIAEHDMDYTYDGKQTGCSCGHWQPRGPVSATADHAAHLAEVLATAGHGKPEPDIEWGVASKWGGHAFASKATALAAAELHISCHEEARLIKRTAATKPGPWERAE